jgi:hypothetical protein
MPRTNWLRMIIGILIATIIMFFSDGFFHERIVVADWTAVYTALGIRPPVHSAANLLYFVIFELGRGILAMSLYVMLRVCWKPGPAAAALAGIVMWIAFSVTGPAQFIPLGFYSHELWVKVAAFQLVTSVIATIAGAAIYREGK